MNTLSFFPLSSVSLANDPKVSCVLLMWISVFESDFTQNSQTYSMQFSQMQEEGVSSVSLAQHPRGSCATSLARRVC